MPSTNRTLWCCLVVAFVCFARAMYAREVPEKSSSPETETTQSERRDDSSIEEIRSLLDSIDPYLPKAEVVGEIDIFGSTSMDSLAHGWTIGFKKFHPDAKVIIAAEGSETVFERLLKNPASIGMLSRPVTREDLAKLKAEGLKQPVAVQVARDALGVFVHTDNPLKTISYQQLVALFCREGPSATINWSAVGVQGELAERPVQLIGRAKNSGTRKFVEDYLFHAHSMSKDEQYLESNAEVVKALAANPQGIAIVDLNTNGAKVKHLGLREESTVIEGTDHEVFLGRYPITRPMTLVFDLGQSQEKVAANREFVRYALAQAGQTQAILAGFYPFDPPTLRAELEKIEEVELDPATRTATRSEEFK